MSARLLADVEQLRAGCRADGRLAASPPGRAAGVTPRPLTAWKLDCVLLWLLARLDCGRATLVHSSIQSISRSTDLKGSAVVARQVAQLTDGQHLETEVLQSLVAALGRLRSAAAGAARPSGTKLWKCESSTVKSSFFVDLQMAHR